jgi:hypothetical protein
MHSHWQRDKNTNQVLPHGHHGRDDGKQNHLGPPTRNRERLAPNPTVVKKAIISGVCRVVSKVKSESPCCLNTRKIAELSMPPITAAETL